ncbi:uncharacterized protein LOC108153400 isoform X2 [Drosophila miranda]|uniref:uncharacterized protein LOC108153400 isoform X2 n=1 Tax=Drosophila miranda TaxID=7229 RepID=UPI00143F3F93|nr:uncharacterized protein LOC108153400 isoform X2 [Drosophila miranda]
MAQRRQRYRGLGKTSHHCHLREIYVLAGGQDRSGTDHCQRRYSVELHRLSQFTDIRAVWTPDAQVLHNHTEQLPKLFPKLHSQRGVTRSTRDVCSCPKHLMLLEDQENYGICPDCGPDHFTCTAPVMQLGNCPEGHSGGSGSHRAVRLSARICTGI